MNPRIHPELPYNGVLCRYNEIATKGRNRRVFEQLLIDRLRRVLAELGPLRVMQERGRIFLRHPDRGRTFTAHDCHVLRKRLPLVQGLASASPCLLVEPELAAVRAAVSQSFPKVYAAFAAAFPPGNPIRYSMRARRSNKSFPLTSHDLEVFFAEAILPAYPRLEVDLQHADLCVEVEIRAKRAVVFYERIPGPGGLPTGSGGRVLALLSGGIDSPVAAYQMIKRGCELDFLTFHSAPYTPPELLHKIARLVRLLNAYQYPGRLVAVNLLPAQKAIRDVCQNRYRTLLYRRLMMRLATIIAGPLGAGALVTGESLGQVASQTLENMNVIAAATRCLILRPLVCFDKFEAVAIAERLGALSISNEPIPDSCTVFAPANPATAARPERVARDEARLDMPGLLRTCVAGTGVVSVDTLEVEPLPGLDAFLETWLARSQP